MSMSTACPTDAIHYIPTSTLGAAIIGAFAAAILYGMTLLQSFVFFQSNPKASRLNKYTKVTVWLLWATNTLHMALIIHPVYWYTVLHYTDPFALVDIVWSIAAGVVITNINDMLVRSWFIYRVWILSRKSPYFTVPLVICAVLLFGITFSTGVKACQSRTLLHFSEIKWLVELDFSLLFIVDFLIAGTLCFLLAQYRNLHLSHETESYLNILMIYTIHTGLLTSVLSFACLITYVTMPDNYIFIAIFFPLASLYANSLLASFNMPDVYLQHGRSKERGLPMPLGQLNSEGSRNADILQSQGHDKPRLTSVDGARQSTEDLVIHIKTEHSQTIA
ncbi:hypothetical protein PsYK624_098160 [Phanerochaete sordida]|uniref:DUF6534 domain-containing protein n=1 Tax=Phanerochaete sordida TaxID=48140 RepID=A0A9P3LFL7_9APHY|nr:hypothetical protein PsYK624_098160 [Phanerochaete sordida]